MGNHCIYTKCNKCGNEYCYRCDVYCNCKDKKTANPHKQNTSKT